jgi:hypothetical protein
MQLHISNGDSAGDMLKASSKIEGEILCWRDVLHDGPIIALEGNEYYKARAAFIHSVINEQDSIIQVKNPNTVTENDILKSFQTRQSLLNNLEKYTQITLWFEHDLYDQLQLAECLYHLAKSKNICSKTNIICIGEHQQIPYFHGLGNLSIVQMEALFNDKKALTIEHLKQGSRVWHAIASNTATDLQALISENFSALPFMHNALRRFAQEYPALEDGLTLSQRYILQSLAEPLSELPILLANLKSSEQNGHLQSGFTAEKRYQQIMSEKDLSFTRLFINTQTLEQAPFLGDTWLMKEILTLSNANVPYIQSNSVKSKNSQPHQGEHQVSEAGAFYSITEAGLAALQGNMHWYPDNDYDLWRGGIHINNEHLIMWNEKESRLVNYNDK